MNRPVVIALSICVFIPLWATCVEYDFKIPKSPHGFMKHPLMKNVFDENRSTDQSLCTAWKQQGFTLPELRKELPAEYIETRLKVILADYEEGDVIWWIAGGSFEGMTGRMGYALFRDGILIRRVITFMN